MPAIRRRFRYPCADLVTLNPRIDLTLDAALHRLGATPHRPLLEASDPRRTIAVIGFPRSGNTFVSKWLEWVAEPGTTVIDGRLTHSALDGHRLTKAGAAVVIPVREPVSTCASWLVRSDAYGSVDAARRTLRSYTAWYRAMAPAVRPPNVLVVDFEALTTDLSMLSHWQRLEGLVRPETASALPDFEEWLVDHLSDVPGQGMPEAGVPAHQMSSLPNDDRLSMNEQATRLITSLSLAKELAAASRAFDRIHECPGTRMTTEGVHAFGHAAS